MTGSGLSGGDASERRTTRWRRHIEATNAQMMAEAAGLSAGTPVAPPTDGPLAGPYQLKRAQLGLDLKRLREIESVERKIVAKHEMVADYQDHLTGWIEGARAALAEGRGLVQDEIAVTVMIWLIDVGHYDQALDIAQLVLAGGLSLPERYERNPACLVAEEIATAALSAYGSGGSGSFDLAVLRRTESITAAHDMPDQARAKLFKALGLATAKSAEALDADSDGPAGQKIALQKAALEHFQRAVALNSAVGVKKNIEALVRALKQSAT